MRVTFTLGIGYAGANHEETVEIDEEFSSDEEMNEYLNAYWVEWSNNYIDGGYEIEEG